MQTHEARVEQLLSEMTLAEKVGQMTQIHMDGWVGRKVKNASARGR